MEDIFSKYVLTDDKLKKLMNKKDFNKFLQLKESQKNLDIDLADKIAKAIKKWAISLGATHYTHWFFPLTGKSAEKQVSFLDLDSDGEFINMFSGNSLIKGETDASSFPSGGERMTFEARGYTVWDYSSPVFIKEDLSSNKVLYIPTAFCSYHGVALDEKTPLLRATENLNSEAVKLLHKLGYNDVKNVDCNLGIEQEYFLIDEDLYKQRKDLILTGRTLVGSSPSLSQETYHHYFCQINPKISSFMHELDKELWSEGIMAKIQHNEVAPRQHEIVPVFSSVNIATDQNQLLMEIMNKVASKHGFKVLFHEKPFSKMNGSGKHNNWSLSTDTGINLLDFNKAKEEVFMLFFTSVLSAIDKHYDLLRMSTSCLGNDFRLGGNEAPPSIISVYIGEDMMQVLNDYVKTEKINKKSKTLLDIKTSSVAKLYKDNSDRNRTSPFAYTGNKFEFRMVGSSQSTALSNTVLCTIVADELSRINKLLDKSDTNKNIKDIIIDNIKNHSRIIFNGNSYDKSWHEEAKQRGLVNITNCVDAYKSLVKEETISLFENNKVMSKTELNVRYETYLKSYTETVITETKALLGMTTKQIIPALNKYENRLLDLVKKLREEKLDYSKHLQIIENTNNCITTLYTLVGQLEEEQENLKKMQDALKSAEFARDEILPLMEKLRKVYDPVENLIPNEFKPFPNYDDLLF